MSRSDRILAFDAIRVFAIVSVVAIHSLMPYRALLPTTSPVRVGDDLLHYAVPLFVFISGALLWTRPIHAEKGEYARFLRRRLSLLLVPYVAWSALYAVILIAQSPRPIDPLRLLGLFLTGHVWYHLYFVPMLFTFYLLTPLATRIARFSPELLVLACYGLRILAGPEIEAAVSASFGDLARLYAMHVIAHLPHMALGAWFGCRVERIPKRWDLGLGLLGMGTVVLTAASLGYHLRLSEFAQRFVYPVGLAATLLGIAILALLLEPRLVPFRHPLQAGAALAFGVYLVHPLFLLLVNEVLRARSAEALWWGAPFWLAVLVGVTAASFAVSWLLGVLPLGYLLIALPTRWPRKRAG